MNWYLFIQLALTIGLLALIGFVIFVLMQFRKTLSTFDELLQNINKDLPPVLSKLQMALDGVNSEIDRVEQLVTSFQEVSATVQNTTGFVQRTVASPFIKVGGLASGVGTFLSRITRRANKSD